MKVAITGGIGSGKSHVCEMLAKRGIAVYDCDAAAKRLMRQSAELMRDLRELVGEEVYTVKVQGEAPVLNKPVLARFLLASEANAQAVDEVVHPAVARDFEQSGLSWIESAIFFDSGFDQRVHVDRVVCVTAPLETRIQRVMRRDGISREKTLEWIARQLPQEEVRCRSDYEIVNDGQRDVEQQISQILKQINSSENVTDDSFNCR